MIIQLLSESWDPLKVNFMRALTAHTSESLTVKKVNFPETVNFWWYATSKKSEILNFRERQVYELFAITVEGGPRK